MMRKATMLGLALAMLGCGGGGGSPGPAAGTGGAAAGTGGAVGTGGTPVVAGTGGAPALSCPASASLKPCSTVGQATCVGTAGEPINVGCQFTLTADGSLETCVSQCPGASPAQAQADCTAYIAIFCARFSSCPNTVDAAACTSQLQTSLDCLMIGSEDGELAACETQLSTEACSVLAPPAPAVGMVPAACVGVFSP